MQFVGGAGAGAGIRAGTIANAGPQYKISRMAGFAQRPSSLVVRSDDSVTPVTAGDLNSAAFSVPLKEPIVDVEAMCLKTFNCRNLLPPIPSYQGWYVYGVQAGANYYVAIFKWGAAFNLPEDVQSMPPVLNVTQFCERLSADAEYALLLPSDAQWRPLPGPQFSPDYYAAYVQDALDNPSYVPQYPLEFGVSPDGTIAVQGNAANGTVQYALLGSFVAGSVIGSTLVRNDLTLNALVGQETLLGNTAFFNTPQGSNPAPTPGSFGYLGVYENTEFPKFDGSQSIYVCCDITSSGCLLAKNRGKPVIAVVPLANTPYGAYITYMAQSTTSWISQVSQYFQDIRVELLDENLQPLDLPFNTLVEIEIAFLYADSRL